MANPLFDRIVPAEFAASGQVIESNAEISEFSRLSEIVAADLGAQPGSAQQWRSAPVQFRLAFAWADSRWADTQKARVIVDVQAAAFVMAVCQRCLGVFESDLSAAGKMLIVRENAEQHGYAEFSDWEIWEVAGDTLRPIDVIEEALIMAMPLAPMHAQGEACSVPGAALQVEGPETTRPFAGLKAELEKSK